MNTTASITDEKGRKIEIRKLKPLERMRLMELIGAENSANDRYLGYATLAYCVDKIDGNPVGVPSNKTGLEGTVKELDDEGLNAVAECIDKNFNVKSDQKDVKANLKNE